MDCFRIHAPDGPVFNNRVTLVANYLKQSGVNGDSGPLHIIIGDMNVGDEHIEMCAADVAERGDAVERDAFTLLSMLTEQERATVVAIDWGYFSADGTVRSDIEQWWNDRSA